MRLKMNLPDSKISTLCIKSGQNLIPDIHTPYIYLLPK